MDKRICKALLTITVIEGIFTLLWLLWRPSMERSAVFLGYSAARLLLVVLVLALVLILAWLTIRAYLVDEFTQKLCRWLEKGSTDSVLFTSLVAFFLGALLYGIGLYCLYLASSFYPPFNLSTLRSVYERLIPLIFWFIVVYLQVFLALTIVHYTSRESAASGIREEVVLPKHECILLAVILAATFIVVFFGWKLFWFLTDDAHISFRYVSNSILGYGYVWNLPPFRPVEGYTSFLWVVLLDIVWRVTGIEPPEIANNISLLFSMSTLLLAAWFFMRIPWHAGLIRYRVPLFGLTLLGVITNRTFLAWTSSGLETAMFNFYFTLWIFYCLALPISSNKWIFWISLAAGLAYLTRPDGMLLVGATVCLVGWSLLERIKDKRSQTADILFAFPLLAMPIHMLWRYSFYSAWLPNTYYAKTITGWFWVIQGMQYISSFIIEYSLWLWIVVFLAFLFVITRKGMSPLKQQFSGKRITRWAVISTVTLHMAYYTLRIGGDHFEYRVYSYLILLIFISFAWMINKLRLQILPAAALIILFITLSLPIPWTHWHLSQNLTTREQTFIMKVSVEDAFPQAPEFLRQYLSLFDRMQFDLIEHFNCIRHQEHKVFYLFMKDSLPTREQGFAIPSDDYPVLKYLSVGVTAWVLPRINIIDGFGLNDYVIARNPDLIEKFSMAHERQAPEGYYNCFTPNVKLEGRDVVITHREVELTAQMIVDCEQKFARILEGE